ncbi:DUF2298 domain-containing protein [Teredinibacter waterburyi]|uniref:DUF2298 domain-containing protein n=1 Tax=Teredinibacter waterburyi TaxID=1500538 RepID=UPI00165F0962|nr:DUF2298 domain-containing protein [Teredinibacter waterburyi]
MYFIYLLFTLLLLWIAIAGVTVLANKWIFSNGAASFALARSVGLVAIVLIMFFIEHFIGLGQLHFLLPVGIATAGFVLWKTRKDIKSKDFWRAEIVFIVAFIYALFWRLAFPSISPSSERMTDLFFISNYLQGVTLPPLDNWNPPHKFDYYYAFQHYGAALLGRIFQLNPGTSYNLSLALIGALPITLVWFIADKILSVSGLRGWRKAAPQWLLTLAIVFGGTGLTPLLHAVYKTPSADSFLTARQDDKAVERATQRYRNAVANAARENIIASVRFIGSSRDDLWGSQTDVNQGAAKLLLPETEPVIDDHRMVLPSENFGYQFFLGDYHPTMGGFFLLLIALALLLSIADPNLVGRNIPLQPSQLTALNSNRRAEKIAQGLLAALVPIMIATNTWTFPLLVFLIIGWIAYRYLSGAKSNFAASHVETDSGNNAATEPARAVSWVWLLGGGLVATFLLYPFFITFLSGTLPTPVAWVNGDQHTPLTRFLALHWPLLLLLGLGFWEGRYRRIAWYFSSLWLVLLILSEIIYIDDPTAAQYARTNTVMKWWGWIQVGVLASVGALVLSSTLRAIRWSGAVILVLLTFPAGLDLARYAVYSGKHYFGDLSGHRWYTQTASNRQMFEYLQAAPDGIVLERVIDNAYSNTSIYGIFTGKPVLLGWPSHLRTWHGDVPRVWIMKDAIESFYKGEQENPSAWLRSLDVRYVVFSPSDNNKVFDKINSDIKAHYSWQEFEHSRHRHTGIWVRID